MFTNAVTKTRVYERISNGEGVVLHLGYKRENLPLSNELKKHRVNGDILPLFYDRNKNNNLFPYIVS